MIPIFLLSHTTKFDNTPVLITATFRTFAHALGAFPTWGMMLPVVATALLPDYFFRMAEDNRQRFEKIPAEATRFLHWFKKGRSKEDLTRSNDE